MSRFICPRFLAARPTPVVMAMLIIAVALPVYGLLLIVPAAPPLFAQETTEVQAADAAADEITADDVNDVARSLWCPLCSGVRLDACELKACDQMKDEIAIKLAEGEDLDGIRTYFVNQYGPQVLGEPPRSGFNLLAWVLPFVVLLGGAVLMLRWGRGMLRNQEKVSAAEDAAHANDAVAAGPEEDPYAGRLEDELKAYD
ncbi:MAG: cytochrome c-type biogenesis protein CcmH [Caldilineaceae bacterium]|nr:cytochrome c-type biogenesis protein CcmH [Caldilineaceae bacterium]